MQTLLKQLGEVLVGSKLFLGCGLQRLDSLFKFGRELRDTIYPLIGNDGADQLAEEGADERRCPEYGPGCRDYVVWTSKGEGGLG